LLLDVAELKERLEQNRSLRKTLSAEDAAKLALQNAPIQTRGGDSENDVQLLRRIIAEKNTALEERDSTIAALRREFAAARDRENELND